MRKFRMTIETDIEVELDESIIDVVDDEWRSKLYDLNTPKEIAEHIGYNLLINRAKLSDLDGWADQSDDKARITDGTDDWQITSCFEV